MNRPSLPETILAAAATLSMCGCGLDKPKSPDAQPQQQAGAAVEGAMDESTRRCYEDALTIKMRLATALLPQLGNGALTSDQFVESTMGPAEKYRKECLAKIGK